MARNKKTKQFTFGNMTPVQTRYAMDYIFEGELNSKQIAKRVSKYKNSPSVEPTTISHLRTYIAKHYE